MEIRFLGQSCFQIKSKKATVITDPYKPFGDLKLPKLSADIITISHSHDDHNNPQAIGGTPERPKPFIIDNPGEYEVADISVFGLNSFHDNKKGAERGQNTIYALEADNLRLVHLGDLGHSLKDKKLEEINGVDIIFIPVGGTFTIGAKQAVELIKKIQPKIVIPMHYNLAKSNSKLAPVSDFLKEYGSEKVQPVDKLVVSYDRLPEQGEVVVLNARY